MKTLLQASLLVFTCFSTALSAAALPTPKSIPTKKAIPLPRSNSPGKPARNSATQSLQILKSPAKMTRDFRSNANAQTPSASSDPATTFLQESYSLYNGNLDPADIRVSLTPYQFNLLSYVVKYPKSSHLCAQKGLVDVNGNYFIARGEVVTDPLKIQYLLDNSTAYPVDPNLGPTSIGNLNAYRLANGQFIYFDSANQYAVIDVALFYNSITIYDTFELYASASGFFNGVAITSPVSWDQVKSCLKTFPVGKKNACKQVYVIGEPNCPICKDFYDNMLPYIQSGEVCLNWAQVAFILPTSPNDLWAILEGKTPPNTQGFKETPEGALAYNEFFFNPDADQGGIDVANAGITNPNHRTVNIYNQDFFFWIRVVALGTPTFFYQDITGQTLVNIGSLNTPEDYAIFVAGLKKEKKK